MKKKFNLQSRRIILKLGYVFLSLFLINIVSAQPTKKALLIIDVQENLVNPNSKMHIDTSGINQFFSNINQATLKFKNEGDEVIYVANEWTNPLMNWLTGSVCKKGGKGVRLDKRMNIIDDKVFSKSKPNSLTNKDLLKYLRDLKISDVYVAGLFAEGCVQATVRGLRSEKFNVTVIEDALGSKNSKQKGKVLGSFHKENICTKKTGDIVNQ